MFCVNVIDIAIKNTLDPNVEGIFMSYFLKMGINNLRHIHQPSLWGFIAPRLHPALDVSSDRNVIQVC